MRSSRFIVASVPLVLAACGSDTQAGPSPVTPTPVASAISIGLSSPNVSVAQGQTTSLTVSLTRTNFAGPVDLSVETLPSGLTATFTASSLTGGAASTTIMIVAAQTAAVGSFSVAVRARGAGVTDAVATLAVTIAGPTKNLSLTFCPSDFPIWIATQDNQGDWVRAIPDADGVVRVAMGARGAVASVYGGTDEEVVYGTLAELSAYYQCARLGARGGSKTVSGSATGFATGSGTASLGKTLALVLPGVPFTLDGVADGPLDMVGVIDPSSTFSSANMTAGKMIVRRNQNFGNNAAMPTLDFAGTGAVAPATGRLSVSGLTSGSASVFVDFETATGVSITTFQVLNGGAVHNYVGVPSSLTVPGDLHAIHVIDEPPGSTGPDRSALIYARDVSDRSVLLGPAVGPPSISLLPGTGPARWRAQFPRQSEYGTFATAVFYEDDPKVTHEAALIVTAAYLGTPAPAAWDIVMPDLTSAGFNASWGMRSTAPTEWQITVAGGGAFAQFLSPSDGATLVGSLRASDAGGQARVEHSAALGRLMRNAATGRPH